MARDLDTAFSTSGGPVRVRVTGLSKTVRALQAAGADMDAMRDLMHELGTIVTDNAAGRVPVRTGRLRASLRAGRGKTKAVARAGGARVPYAPIIEYGGYNGITGVAYLRSAQEATQAKVYKRLEEGLGELLERNGLK